MSAPLTCTWPAGTLAAAVEHLRAVHPREGCGALVRREGRLSFVPIENAIDRYHAADPASFPRTSRDGFLLDPRAQLALLAAEARGELQLVAVVHSHCGVGPYFSAADEAGARAPGGDPVLPGVDHVVIALGEDPSRPSSAGLEARARLYRLGVAAPGCQAPSGTQACDIPPEVLQEPAEAC
jgi:proteasome lid subunit RPN8/RPN11